MVVTGQHSRSCRFRIIVYIFVYKEGENAKHIVANSGLKSHGSISMRYFYVVPTNKLELRIGIRTNVGINEKTLCEKIFNKKIN